MRPIPEKLKKQIASDPRMKFCIHQTALCRGKVEWEHAFVYAGKQINEWWAIIGVCVYHHRGQGLDKGFNKYMALKRLNGDFSELEQKYSRENWQQIWNYLSNKYEKQ
jgi:hypothetical protein